jgi:hypothetical protein
MGPDQRRPAHLADKQPVRQVGERQGSGQHARCQGRQEGQALAFIWQEVEGCQDEAATHAAGHRQRYAQPHARRPLHRPAGREQRGC